MNTYLKCGLVAAMLGGCGPGPARAELPAWEQVRTELRARNLAEPAVERVTATFRRCETNGLPVDCLQARLREGLAKNAAPEALALAVETRARFMEQARRMLGAAGYDDRREASHRELLRSAMRALESGVTPEALAGVLERVGGGSALRVQAVIESGESLHLAGLEPDAVRGFMGDCLDRNLRRMEILRAARFSIQQHRGGMDGGAIRRALWGDETATGNGASHRGAGSGRGNQWGGPPSDDATLSGRAMGPDGGGVGETMQGPAGGTGGSAPGAGTTSPAGGGKGQGPGGRKP